MIITWVVVKESAPVSITLLTNTYRGVGTNQHLQGLRNVKNLGGDKITWWELSDFPDWNRVLLHLPKMCVDQF